MKNLKLLPLLAVAAIVATAHAGLTPAPVVFDNTSGTDAGGFGYFNAGSAWGDELTLASPVQVSTFTFKVGDVVDGADTGGLQLSLYTVNPGPDGLFQTSDDTIGTLLGTATKSATLFSSNTFSFTGLAVTVPANFIYTVATSGSLSYTVQSTFDDATVGITPNDNVWANFSGPLLTGDSSSSVSEFYGSGEVQFRGTAVVPEPNPTFLVAGFALLAIGRHWWLHRRGAKCSS